MSDFEEFVKVLASIKDKSLLEDFLLGITTPNERREFGRRLEIVKRLLDKEPQHAIAKELGVGIATVTRGSKELTAGRFKFLRK